VVVGCNSYTAAETIGLAEHARSAGADGALTTPPPYVHPSDEEVLAFYRTVTEAVDLPWMVYNWPRGTAVDLSVAVLDQLADLDRVVAVKDSTGDEIKCLEGCEAVMDRVRFFGRFVHRRGMAFLTGTGCWSPRWSTATTAPSSPRRHRRSRPRCTCSGSPAAGTCGHRCCRSPTPAGWPTCARLWPGSG
jgi:hypothetical protein